MVSTRQMAITTGPCANDDGFQPTTTTHNRGGPSSHHQHNGGSTSGGGGGGGGSGSGGTMAAATKSIVTILALSARRPTSPDACNESTAGPSSVSSSGVVVGVATYVSTPSSYINVQELPIEILEKIFSYVGFKKIAQMRTVSRHFLRFDFILALTLKPKLCV